MIFAKKTDFEKVKQIFYKHKKWFPHVRTDYMMRMIARKQLILEDGILITFHKAKRRQKIGDVLLGPGDTVLHQIASDSPGSGNAQSILNNFFEYCKPGCVFLSVRADNLTANRFYVKMNMNLIGTTSWAKNTIPGNVYVKGDYDKNKYIIKKKKKKRKKKKLRKKNVKRKKRSKRLER